MTNYAAPVEYSDLQKMIEVFLEVNKEDVHWTANFFPLGVKPKDDPLATASIYLHYGYRDRAIASLNEAVSMYKPLIENGDESIRPKLDEVASFLDRARELKSFTPPESKPWYCRVFGNK